MDTKMKAQKYMQESFKALSSSHRCDDEIDEAVDFCKRLRNDEEFAERFFNGSIADEWIEPPVALIGVGMELK